MKKLYSNTLMQLILALCTFSFVACQEFDIDSQPEGPLNIQIDALESYTALATSPSNVVFNISSNTPWTIESDQQWCKPTPSMSAASSLVSEIVVTMENNTGKKARTAKLTIKAEGVEGTKVVTIEQASKEDLVVVPYDELVPTEGGSITFTIASNKAWEIIPSTAFLSNIDKTSGTGNEDAIAETVTVTLPANAGAKRAGTLTVKTEFEEYTFTITQNGVIIELEEDPESTTISMPGTGSGMEKTVLIRANKEWKVEVPKEYQSWLKAEALSETELKVTTTTTNNLMVNRVGHIIMKTKEVIDGFDGITFDISQGTAFWKEGGADNYVVDEETGKILLIQQYGKPSYILVAGYVNRGEAEEHAVVREVREETGLEVEHLRFNRTKFFEPSNTLMCNFTAFVRTAKALHINHEVDRCKWFTPQEARENIRPNSLAAEFLNAYLDEVGNKPMEM